MTPRLVDTLPPNYEETCYLLFSTAGREYGEVEEEKSEEQCISEGHFYIGGGGQKEYHFVTGFPDFRIGSLVLLVGVVLTF